MLHRARINEVNDEAVIGEPFTVQNRGKKINK